MREISLYLLLGHLLIAGVGAGSKCVPKECLNCNTTGATQADPCANCSMNPQLCITKPSAIPENCKKDFQVSIKSKKSTVQEGEDIDLSCTHNLPNLTLTFEWKWNGKTVKDGINKIELSLKKVLSNKAGKYTCIVGSRCGIYESSPHDVTVNTGVGAGSNCVPMECLNCNTTGATQADPCASCSMNPPPCITKPSAIPENCKKDFQVSIKSNKSKVEEGEDIDLSCTHNLPNLTLTFGWKRNGKKVKDGINKTELSLKKVLSNKAGKYTCFVGSRCGKYESTPHNVTVNNNTVVLLVICGVSALALVVILGLAMKFKLKRDNAKHRDRARQKAKDEQSRVPAPFTPRES